MSEVLAKPPILKKGFIAPILKSDKPIASGNKEEEKSCKELKNQDRKILKSNGTGEKKCFKKVKNQDEKNLNSNRNEQAKKSPKKSKNQPTVSLSDSQYEEIFSGVLNMNESSSNSQPDIPVKKVSHLSEANCKDKSPVNEPQRDETKAKLMKRPGDGVEPHIPAKASKTSPIQSRPASPWGRISKHTSEAFSLLKELKDSEDTEIDFSELSSLMMSSENTVVNYDITHPPHTVLTGDQRTRLEQLQQLRNVGVWVHCGRQSCNKLRYLANVLDPQDVPQNWYCHMNPDPKYNHCLSEQQPIAPEDAADLIFNEHTAGSLVWAKVAGFPWWPAMVDDDPDLEMYYWPADDFETVTFYHVVFFDETSVSRAWVDCKHIVAYKNFRDKRFPQEARGINFRQRISVAREQADNALGLSKQERLRVYSFIARYKGNITTSTLRVKRPMKKSGFKLRTKIKKPSQKETTAADFSDNYLKKSVKMPKEKRHKSDKTQNIKEIMHFDMALLEETIENVVSNKENSSNVRENATADSHVKTTYKRLIEIVKEIGTKTAPTVISPKMDDLHVDDLIPESTGPNQDKDKSDQIENQNDETKETYSNPTDIGGNMVVDSDETFHAASVISQNFSDHSLTPERISQLSINFVMSSQKGEKSDEIKKNQEEIAQLDFQFLKETNKSVASNNQNDPNITCIGEKMTDDSDQIYIAGCTGLINTIETENLLNVSANMTEYGLTPEKMTESTGKFSKPTQSMLEDEMSQSIIADFLKNGLKESELDLSQLSQNFSQASEE